MEVLNYSELRKNLAAHLESVANEHELLIVSRGEGKNVVLLSLEDYNALKETAHLLGSAGNAIRLQESLQEAKGGTFERHNLQD